VNIKKKLAVFGAFALPFAGLAAFGGAQAASAAAPILTCQIVGPGSGITAGETWSPNSDGSDPGTASVDFDASAGGNMELAAGANPGATTLSLTDPVGSVALAISGQVLTITGANGPADPSGTYTVTADSFSAIPPHTPDAVTITPGLSIPGTPPKALKTKDTVTVAPTTNTPYRSVKDATFTSGSATMTSATASFVNSAYTGAPGGGDVGAPVAGEIGATHGSGGASITGTNGADLTIASVQSSTSVTLSSVVQQQTSAGPPPTYGNISGTGVVTIGETLAAPASIYTVTNETASECGASAVSPGEFAPLTANMAGVAEVSGPNAALALEAAPPETLFSITYPTIGSGWADEGGYPNAASQPSTSLNFPGGKDNAFDVDSVNAVGACPAGSVNCDSYTKGTATGDWGTTKGTLSLTAYGLIFCTLGEAQAINSNTGPDSTGGGGWISPTNNNPLVVCDGGSGNPSDHSEESALGVVEALELSPSSSAYGSDNTAPTSIWNAIAAEASNAVF